MHIELMCSIEIDLFKDKEKKGKQEIHHKLGDYH